MMSTEEQRIAIRNAGKMTATCMWLEIAIANGKRVVVRRPHPQEDVKITNQEELGAYLEEQGRTRMFPWLKSRGGE